MSPQPTTEVVTRGVVAEMGGEYWGVQDEDGRSRVCGWGPIENATIGNEQFCREPKAMTYPGSPDENALSSARLVRVTKTVRWEIGPSVG